MRALTGSKAETPKIEIQVAHKWYPGAKSPVAGAQNGRPLDRGGEFVSIVGPSGCGKSTLLYVVGGFLEADGKVFVDGRRSTVLARTGESSFRNMPLFPALGA